MHTALYIFLLCYISSVPPLLCPHLPASSPLPLLQAVRKLTEAKKLESTMSYDSAFGDGGKQ